MFRYHSFQYQAVSWDKLRRVVAKRGQPGETSTIHPGLPPGKLPAPIGFVGEGATWVVDDLAGEAHQDRG